MILRRNKIKLSKKLLKAKIAATAVIAAATAVLSFFEPPVKKSTTTTSKLREVASISELSTGEFCYNARCFLIPEKNNAGKTDYSVKHDSTVKAGIDAKDIRLGI